MFDIDSLEVNGIFRWIVRGLYFHHREQRIPDNYPFDVLRHDVWDFIPLVRKLQQDSKLAAIHTLGNVFGYAYSTDKEDPYETWWCLWFYDAVCYSVVTKKINRQ